MAEPQKTEKSANEYRVNDPAEFSRNMVKVAAQSQRLVSDFMKAQMKNGNGSEGGGSRDPLNLGRPSSIS